ncbi:MAG TPA: O-methyltransferase [Flammeovirgaceae bacterium]|nr:O-methyltransferase [Flammeovirgaceae bacterium]
MEFIPPEINAYAEAHTTAEPELLQRINRETHLEVLYPRMLSGHLQGRLLAMLARMIKPAYIVEVGTYTGYSALCLAEGLRPAGKLITIEKNPELEKRIRNYLKASTPGKQIELRIGDAQEIIPTLPDGIDLAFIDADKVSYLKYYELLLDKLQPGGYLLADNVLWSGKVTDENARDVDTVALQKFNNFVQADERVENVLLPVRDGLMMIRKR